jgi:hypothetical protein
MGLCGGWLCRTRARLNVRRVDRIERAQRCGNAIGLLCRLDGNGEVRLELRIGDPGVLRPQFSTEPRQHGLQLGHTRILNAAAERAGSVGKKANHNVRHGFLDYGEPGAA